MPLMSRLLEHFLDLSSLADSLAQIVQLSAADLTGTYYLDLLHYGRMNGEYSLDTAAVCNAANGECLVDAAVLLGDNSTLEDLDPRLVAFSDPYMDLDGVTDAELRCIFFHA